MIEADLPVSDVAAQCNNLPEFAGPTVLNLLAVDGGGRVMTGVSSAALLARIGGGGLC